MVGRSNYVSKACPRWFMPIWISKPSAVVEGGTAMMPALFMRMSRREVLVVTSLAAAAMEAKEERSRGR